MYNTYQYLLKTTVKCVIIVFAQSENNDAGKYIDGTHFPLGSPALGGGGGGGIRYNEGNVLFKVATSKSKMRLKIPRIAYTQYRLEWVVVEGNGAKTAPTCYRCN